MADVCYYRVENIGIAANPNYYTIDTALATAALILRGKGGREKGIDTTLATAALILRYVPILI